MRGDVVDIVRRLKAIPGMETLAITTNGLTLARKLPDLKAAGLDAINIRFDSHNSDYQYLSTFLSLDSHLQIIDLNCICHSYQFGHFKARKV